MGQPLHKDKCLFFFKLSKKVHYKFLYYTQIKKNTLTTVEGGENMQENKNLPENSVNFEDFKNENGMIFWWASQFMVMLGYHDMKHFQKVIDRATKAFINLNIKHFENIIPEQREEKGESFQDFRLTRFACYLIAMNGDPKKPEVATAQAYFAEQTRKFELQIQKHEEVERVALREELKEGNTSLSRTAKQADVLDFAKFQNAGYLGLYNRYNWQLAKMRGIQANQLLEHMGRTELAINIFRVAMTDERIKNRNIKGQKDLERTHHEVGKEVRDQVIKNVGKPPEYLPVEKKLPEVQKELKKGYRGMLKNDSPKKKKNK